MNRPPHEAGTTSFGRLDGDHQWLAYALRVDVADELSIAIPLPIRSGALADDIQVHALRDFPEMFSSLQRAFPLERIERPLTRGIGPARADDALEVRNLGDYTASLALTAADLARLRPDFAPRPRLLEEIPVYADYAFLVLRVKPPRRVMIDMTRLRLPVEHHPIAVRFPTRWPARIFMPTLFAHNGDLPETVSYDHLLLCQTNSNTQPAGAWQRSARPAGRHVEKQPVSVVDPSLHVFRRSLKGDFRNQDLLLPASP